MYIVMMTDVDGRVFLQGETDTRLIWTKYRYEAKVYDTIQDAQRVADSLQAPGRVVRVVDEIPF